ncbi:MAG: hypothetical protein HYY76_13940 [Acidobacteria bacterium]|nr:hypothetical protein [Acidobacteriota bacterium]
MRALPSILVVFFLLPPASYFLTGSQDLPDPDTFYRRVRENLARAERANHLYVYRERRTDVHTNPFGRIGTDGVSVFEVYPSPVRQLVYRRLVERNGEPVPASELARQDREYRERVDEMLRERGARGPDEERLAEEESERARQRRQRAIDDVVDALEFTLTGRTVYNGVPAIVITFKPRPGARPTTRQGRTAQKFAGTVWVDEKAAEVMHLEATSIDDISYGLGIVARLGEGTTATVTRAPVGDGLWMPTKLTLSGRGRAVVFRRLVVDYSIEWYDYRRLGDDSLAPFLDARVQGQAGGSP